MTALARNLDVDPPFERVPIGLVIGLDIADVTPVARRQVPVERHGVGQHLGEDIAAPVHHRRRRQQIEHFRFDDVNAGVHLIGKHLAPGWLLEEAFDRPVRVGDHHPELQWVRHGGEDDGRGRAFLAVIAHDPTQVDVGQGVAADDDEGLGQVFLRILHAAGGAEWGVFDHVSDVDDEVRTVAEVVADRRPQVLKGDHHIRDPVLPQQPKDVLHDRLANHRNERLRHAAGQGSKP